MTCRGHGERGISPRGELRMSPLTEEERTLPRSLVGDVARFWSAAETTAAEGKRRVRYRIRGVVPGSGVGTGGLGGPETTRISRKDVARMEPRGQLRDRRSNVRDSPRLRTLRSDSYVTTTRERRQPSSPSISGQGKLGKLFGRVRLAETNPCASGCRVIASGDNLEDAARILGRGWNVRSVPECTKGLCEYVPSRVDQRISRISREVFSAATRFPPGKPGDAIIESEVRGRAPVKPGREARASTKRRPQ